MPNQTFDADKRFEDGNDPDWRIVIGNLDLDAIHKWWLSFKTSHEWKTLSQNCSTTVADALWAGGAAALLTQSEIENFQAVAVWTPNNVLTMAQAIKAHAGHR
jgi:hypothetical protein